MQPAAAFVGADKLSKATAPRAIKNVRSLRIVKRPLF
jgi:hypothetical protein